MSHRPAALLVAAACTVTVLGFSLTVAAHERPAIHAAQAPGHNPLECYCRAQGKMFAPGQAV